MAVPEQQRRVDLPGLKQALLADGYEVPLDARVLLLVRREAECTVYNTGKVLIKTRDKDAAQTTYDGLRPHLEAAYQ